MTVETRFEPGQRVAHVCDVDSHGIVTAFMVRGKNHSYEVNWARDKSEWHMDFELVAVEKPAHERETIGWRASA